MKRVSILILFFFISVTIHSQQLEYRSVGYYFGLLKKKETKRLQESGLIDQNLNITKKFKEKGKNKLNKAGQDLYFEIRMNLLKSYFKDYLYQQHLDYKGETYVLYFSMAGFDDTEWCILKWKKGQWKNVDKIDKQLVENSKNNIKNKDFSFICFNYDEGPKNMDGVRIFIKNNYLVMERGGLYHSLFDLKSQKLLLNESCPYCACNANTKEEMNIWIKKNLHDKIDKTINR